MARNQAKSGAKFLHAPNHSALARVRVFVFMLVGAIPVSGCATPPPPQPSPTVIAAPPTVPPSQLAEARQFRSKVGLRADDIWIIGVESSSAATHEFGVALTQAEAAELKRRPVVYDAIAKVVTDYAERHRTNWAGLYIDQSRGGTVVALFTDDLELHRESLLRLVAPEARLEIHQAVWTLDQLQLMADRISTNRAWLRAIPAVLRGSGVDIRENRVVVKISSRNPDAADLLADHFKASGMLDVRSDGTGVLLLPWGELVVRARDASGHPVRGLMCVPIPDIPGAFDDGSTYGTDRLGTCSIPVRAGAYEVQLRIQQGSGEWKVVGHGRAVVPANGVGTTVIRVAK
jgi:hypothetical protein